MLSEYFVDAYLGFAEFGEFQVRFEAALNILCMVRLIMGYKDKIEVLRCIFLNLPLLLTY